MVSSTVTVAVHAWAFPEASVAVSVTVLEPMLAQPKEVWLTDNVGAPQLSVDPLFTWLADNVALPELFR